MQIQRKTNAVIQYEYGCDLRRLFPWEGVANPLWGAAIASVRPGESTTIHGHDELEIFLVISGSGQMNIEGEMAILYEGDVVMIPRNKAHCFQNLSDEVPLVFLTIFWDSPEARERMNRLGDNEDL